MAHFFDGNDKIYVKQVKSGRKFCRFFADFLEDSTIELFFSHLWLQGQHL